MRIAFVTHQFPRLPNTFILNEITEIIKNGHDITIYSLERSGDRVVHPDVHRFGLLEKTRFFLDYIVEDPENRHRFRAYARQKLPVHLHAFPGIGEELLAEGCQLIHAGFGNRPCTAALALAEITALPLTFESHAFDLFVDFPMAEEKIARSEAVFTISEYNKRYLMDEHGCPAEKLFLRRVSIVEDFCDGLEGEEREEGLLVFVGRLHPIKGIRHALEAVALVRGTHPKARLLVIGEGEERGELEGKAQDLRLSGHVTFTGPLDNEEALRHVARASAFLLPSVIVENGDRDGIPTALIEAMYLRTPAISTRVSGIPELVDDEINGFLVEPGDVDAMANRIRFILDNPERGREMGEKAREKVKLEFSAERNTRIVLDVWDRIVSPV